MATATMPLEPGPAESARQVPARRQNTPGATTTTGRPQRPPTGHHCYYCQCSDPRRSKTPHRAAATMPMQGPRGSPSRHPWPARHQAPGQAARRGTRQLA
eukprot:4854738-Alexandrium_andersonii.AAC.1